MSASLAGVTDPTTGSVLVDVVNTAGSQLLREGGDPLLHAFFVSRNVTDANGHLKMTVRVAKSVIDAMDVGDFLGLTIDAVAHNDRGLTQDHLTAIAANPTAQYTLNVAQRRLPQWNFPRGGEAAAAPLWRKQ